MNDAPSGADTTKTTLEDFTHTFAATDFGFTDADGNALSGVKITTVPLVGWLTLDNSAVAADQVISAADIAAGELKFAPAPNASGFGYASDQHCRSERRRERNPARQHHALADRRGRFLSVAAWKASGGVNCRTNEQGNNTNGHID